jgi:hypothetical protein
MAMLKVFIYIIFLIPIILTSCDNNPSMHKSSESAIVAKGKLDGNWILTEYYDSILTGKSIAKNRLHEISWNMFAFKIDGENLTSLGILYPKTKYKINQSKDTLLTFKEDQTYSLKFNPTKNLINAFKHKFEGNNSLSSSSYTFRRVNEKRLQSILKNNNPFAVREELTKLFEDSLIVGEYYRIDSPVSESISLLPNKKMKGFRNFYKYNLHCYFGTYHPYQNYDEITFYSQDKTANYSWQFKGDTLKLTELVTEDGDEYNLTNTTILFKRRM